MTRQTLQDLLHERVAVFANGERPREIIDASVERMFQELTDDAFRSYGEMGKAVRDAFKAAMPANISDMFELTRYNHMIANALRERWLSSGLEGDMLRRANEALDDILKDGAIPAMVSLKEFLETFIEDNKETAHNSGWDRPEIRFEHDEQYGRYLHVYFDAKPESACTGSYYSLSGRRRSDYELSHALHMSFLREEKDEHGNDMGRVYAARLNGEVIGKEIGISGKWQRQIAGLYYGAAKIVVDCEPNDFSYNLYH